MTEPIDSDLLDELDDYLDDRADCDVQGDPPEYKPNKAMNLLGELRRARGERCPY